MTAMTDIIAKVSRSVRDAHAMSCQVSIPDQPSDLHEAIAKAAIVAIREDYRLEPKDKHALIEEGQVKSESDFFRLSDTAKTIIPNEAVSMFDQAEVLAKGFMSTGHTYQEAASIVAHILVRTGWAIACNERLSIGEQPDKQRFRETVEDAFQHVRFSKM
jgi:hypothetical protein